LRADLAALGLLTGALVRRLLREAILIRSLVFPIAITLGTLVGTIGVVAWVRYTPAVALSPDVATVEIVERIEAERFRVVVREDPLAAVDAGEAWGASDGRSLVLTGGGPAALVLESLLRERVRAPWRPDVDVPRPDLSAATRVGRRIAQLIGVLFSLYGVVFGAGMVARDRDDGTFEVELSLGVRRWVHGAARLLAGSTVLVGFFAVGVALCAAVVGLADPIAFLRHGVGMAVGSVALGLLAVGRAGLSSGFTTPLAFGISGATALFGLGAAAPEVGRFVPLASLVTDTSGWESLPLTALVGALAVVVFTLRSARA
jgi:hypothetical protein